MKRLLIILLVLICAAPAFAIQFPFPWRLIPGDPNDSATLMGCIAKYVAAHATDPNLTAMTEGGVAVRRENGLHDANAEDVNKTGSQLWGFKHDANNFVAGVDYQVPLSNTSDVNVRDINIGGSLRGKTGNIVKIDTNGITTPYIESADTPQARGTAFLAALATAQAGDKIYTNADFNTNTTLITVPAGVMWFGGGTTSVSTQVEAAAQVLVNNGVVLDGISFFYPSGQKYLTPNINSAITIRNCTFAGHSLQCQDNIYFAYSGGSAYVYNTTFHSNYDTLNTGPGVTDVYFYADDCNFVIEANDTETTSILRGLAFSVSNGTFQGDIRNSRITLRNLQTSGTQQVTGISIASGTLNLRNCTIARTSTTPAPLTDFDIYASAGTINVSNTNGSGLLGKLSTSGTVNFIDHERIVQTLNAADNNYTGKNNFAGTTNLNNTNVTTTAERGIIVGTSPIVTSGTKAYDTNWIISAADGNAFVDFNVASILTDYVGKFIAIKDNQNRAITGWMAASSGKTFSANYLTNGTFDTDLASWQVGNGVIGGSAGGQSGNCFWTQGSSPGNAGYAYDANVVIPAQSRYYVSGYVKDGNGTGKNVTMGFYGFGTVGAVTTSSWTLKEAELFTTAGTSGVQFRLTRASNGNTSSMFDEINVKTVLTPSTNGVRIVSTKGGTTYNWASKNASFDYVDTNGYTYAIYDAVPGDLYVAGNVTIGGNVVYTNSENKATTGNLSTTGYSHLAPSSGSQVFTLPDGTNFGDVKVVDMNLETYPAILLVTHEANDTNKSNVVFTYDDVNDFISFVWNGKQWIKGLDTH